MKALYLWLAALLLVQPLAAADPTSASRSNPFSQEGGTARAMAMGSAYVGIAEGSAALLWNPAGLATMHSAELGLHHNSALGNSFQEIAVLGSPVGDMLGFAVSANYLDSGEFEGRDESGNMTGTFRASDIGGSVGLGLDLGGVLFLGASLKGNQQTLAGQNTSSFSGDVGLLFKPVSPLSIGIAYLNLGPDVSGAPLAQGLRGGLAWTVGRHQDNQLILAASGEMQAGGLNRIQAGVEDTLYRFLSLRAGYSHTVSEPAPSDLSGVTLGLGLELSHMLALDYAYLPKGELGNSQRVTLTLRFGGQEAWASEEMSQRPAGGRDLGGDRDLPLPPQQ